MCGQLTLDYIMWSTAVGLGHAWSSDIRLDHVWSTDIRLDHVWSTDIRLDHVGWVMRGRGTLD